MADWERATVDEETRVKARGAERAKARRDIILTVCVKSCLRIIGDDLQGGDVDGQEKFSVGLGYFFF